MIRRTSTDLRLAFLKIKKEVQEFFEDDAVSRLCPGKRATITYYRKLKKQKRYLNSTMRNLYEDYKKNHRVISYAIFCKLRPFWVLPLNAKLRETCLCITHDNINLLISKLKTLRIMNSNTPKNLLKEICCDVFSEDCLTRKCKVCSGKQFTILDYAQDDIVSYEQWVTTKLR